MYIKKPRQIESGETIGVETYILAFFYSWGFSWRIAPQMGILRAIPIRELVVVVLLGLYFLKQKSLRLDRPLPWLLAVLMVYYSLDSIWKEGPSQAMHGALSMLSWWAVLFVGLLTERNKKEIRLLLTAIKLSCLVCCISILMENQFSQGGDAVQIFGVWTNRNWIIDYTLPGLMIHLIQMTQKRKRMVIDYLVAAVFLYANLLPQSRSHFLGIAATCGLIIFSYLRSLLKRGKNNKTICMIAVIAVLVVAIYFVLPDTYKDRVINTDNYTVENSDRVEIWKDGISMVTDRIFGMGPSYYELNTDYRWRFYGTHNMFVDLYIDSGILGAGIMICVFLCFFRKDWLALALWAFPVVRVLFEAGRTPGTWGILLVLGCILYYCETEKITVTEFFGQLYGETQTAQEQAVPLRAVKTCIRSQQSA